MYVATCSLVVKKPLRPQSFGEEGARLGRGRERTHDRAMPVQKPATPEELQALFDKGGKLVVYLSATW